MIRSVRAVPRAARVRAFPYEGVRLGCALLLALLLAPAAARAEGADAAPPPVAAEQKACDESAGMDDRPAEAEAPAPAEAPLETPPGADAVTAPTADADAALDVFAAELDAAPDYSDPLEPLNRHILSFNRGVDYVLLDPLTRAYAFVMPDLARQSVRNLFANLNTPVVLVNDVLQLRGKDALVTTARFVINSTMGMAGLFDPATTFGLEANDANFSQTLSVAGVPTGPYLVVPLFGPTTVRDGFGGIVDLAMSPQAYVLPLLPVVIVAGSGGFAERERHQEGLDALRESSIDYYASLRSAYLESNAADDSARD